MYLKSEKDSTIVLSEVSTPNPQLDRTLRPPAQTQLKLDVQCGCAGLAFNRKEIIFEPFAQSSSIVSKEELNPETVGLAVRNLIAIPVFDEHGNSIGVCEALNCDAGLYSVSGTKPLLTKLAKYISLLLYTNGLLIVRMCSER